MIQFGENCSTAERRADAASYSVIDALKCEYMQDRVGDEFVGTITSVTSFGLFVELNDIYVEGLVHISELSNDYYHFDPVHHCLTGERSQKTYRLGDSVEVKVVRVDLDDKKIDLQMIGLKQAAKRAGKSKPSDSKKIKGKHGKKAGPSKNAKDGKASKKPKHKKRSAKSEPDTRGGSAKAPKKKKATEKNSAAAAPGKKSKSRRRKKPNAKPRA
jgi:ribonuclease R